MNELLGAGARYSRGIAVQFGLEEQEGAPTVAPELVPVSDIHARPEQWALHGGVLLFGAADIAAGGAGTRAVVQCQPGSGEVVVIEGIIPGDTMEFLVGFTNAPATTSTGNLVSRDARMISTAGGSGSSGTRLRTQSNFTAFANSAIFSMNTGVFYPLDIVLVDPWGWAITPLAQNTALNQVYFQVRVRNGTPRELAAGGVGGGAL